MAGLKSKLTVVDTVYYQCVGGEPVSVESKFSRELDSDEQIYQRHSKVGEDFIPLDCGWLERNVGMLLITNEEGKNLQAHPTEEEAETLSRRVLEVRYKGNGLAGGWLIPPGESFRGYPSNTENLVIRCQVGTAQFTINLIPK